LHEQFPRSILMKDKQRMTSHRIAAVRPNTSSL
jgi:hypothetical protein